MVAKSNIHGERKYQEKRFQSNGNNPFAIRPKFWLLLSKVGLEKKIFKSGTGSFGRTGPTVKKDHLWRSTTLTGKFPRRPKRSIFLDWNFKNFGIMETILCYTWCLKEIASRAEPSRILWAIIGNAPPVSSKVEEKGSQQHHFITDLSARKEWETSGCWRLTQ